MATCHQKAQAWTATLRRQPVRMVRGRAEGGYTDEFEIVCCDCRALAMVPPGLGAGPLGRHDPDATSHRRHRCVTEPGRGLRSPV